MESLSVGPSEGLPAAGPPPLGQRMAGWIGRADATLRIDRVATVRAGDAGDGERLLYWAVREDPHADVGDLL